MQAQSTKNTLAIVMGIWAVMSFYFPSGIGFNYDATITTGEGRIMGAIFAVGALILWYLPAQRSN